MATIKHISSKNADYGAAEAYLTFEHDEFTMKPTLDEAGRLIPRQDYRLDTLNCGEEDFALSCIRANLRYGKNSKREDIKSHHYIISFDPRDAADNGLTVDRAQALGLAYCKEHFPGHQALVCTHPDGHSHSGNIHVHIVINSLRIAEVERKPYMDRASDTRAGDKHRCTAAAMRYFRSEVMEMCHREGLYQIDLLNGSRNKVTEREYWAKRKGQVKLDKENAALLAEGIAPRQTKFETDKDRLRQTIRQALATAASFEEFSALLLRDGVTVKKSRGRLSYLTPDRTKPITARKLGTDFDKAAVLAVFQQNAVRAVQRAEYHPQISGGIRQEKTTQITPNPDSPQRLVDIQKKLSEGKGKGYERWAKTFNLKQMAKTMNFLSEHGFASPEEVDAALEAAISGQHAAGEKLKELESRITANKELMEYMNDRISTYYLFPFKKKCTSLLKRIVISQVYLIALIAVFYWGFVLMYHPTNYSGVSIAVLYIQCVCACAASMFFMGILCFTATNLLRNIGIGIGCVFLLWLFLTSSITRILPQLLQLFKLSGEVVQDGFLTPYWPSRILYAVVAIGLLFLNLYLVNKQPDYNKKGWCKHGNKGK